MEPDECGLDGNGENCDLMEDGEQPQQREEEEEEEEEPRLQDEKVTFDSEREVAAENPLSGSSAGKRGREENGVIGGPPGEEQVSKKQKAATVDSAQLEKGRQQKQQQQDGGKKKKKERVFQYGNYHRYYGYRLGETADEDPRLKFFKREWFEGKDCLDIGCNEGFVTISIAQKYNCRSILGVDIDNFLIKTANRKLKEAAASEARNLVPLEEGRLEDTVVVRACDSTGERAGNESAPDLDDERPCLGSESLLQRVKFREEQFIEDFPDGDYNKDGTFDTVLCLSVTKWIHLNWGDTGLIRLFAKIYHVLRPGGILILEPQPWKSYLKKYFVSKVTKQCFRNIQLTPAYFKEVLLDKIGFKSVEEISQAVPNSSLGFDRPLFLYLK